MPTPLEVSASKLAPPVAAAASFSSAYRLKTDPVVFDAVAAGLKTFEIRKEDRGYKAGDFLELAQTRYTGEEMANGKPLEYTGKSVTAYITHVLRGPIYGIQDGWAILSIASVELSAIRLRALLSTNFQENSLPATESIGDFNLELHNLEAEVYSGAFANTPLVGDGDGTVALPAWPENLRKAPYES